MFDVVNIVERRRGGSLFSKMFSPGPVQTKGLVNLPDFLPNLFETEYSIKKTKVTKQLSDPYS